MRSSPVMGEESVRRHLDIAPYRRKPSSNSIPSAQEMPSHEAVESSVTVGRRYRAPLARSYARPWRKTRAECEAERAQAARILGTKSDGEVGHASGVDAQGLFHYIAAQEALDDAKEQSLEQFPAQLLAEPHAQAQTRLGDGVAAQAAIDALRQVATNASSAEEVQAAKNVVAQALQVLGIEDSFRLGLHRPPVIRGDVCHLILPRLWLGSCAALNNGCEELRRRRVTHVLSVLSADKRRLPDFIRSHLHIHQDDKEEASAALAGHFPQICRFIDRARSEPRGCVYVHCGAGISRAPTSVACYVMWKLGVPAATALQLIRRVRPAIRPNLGFVSQLKAWEATMHDLPRDEPAGSSNTNSYVADPIKKQHGHLSGTSRCQKKRQVVIGVT